MHEFRPTITILAGGTAGAHTARQFLRVLDAPETTAEAYAPSLEEAGHRDVYIRPELTDAHVKVVTGTADRGGSTGALMRHVQRIVRKVHPLGLGDARNIAAHTSVSQQAGQLFNAKFGPTATQDDLARRTEAILDILRSERSFDAASAHLAYEDAALLAHTLPQRSDGAGALYGHNVGNLVAYGAVIRAAGTARRSGDAATLPVNYAIAETSRAIASRVEVIGSVVVPHELALRDGDRPLLYGEHHIDTYRIMHDGNAEAFLVRSVRSSVLSGRMRLPVPANQLAVQAVRESDVLVFGAGSPYTSGVPSSAAAGLQQAYAHQQRQGGVAVSITNLVARQQDTPDWCVGRFAEHMWLRTDRKPDAVLYNTNLSDVSLRAGERPVELRSSLMQPLGIRVIGADLLEAVTGRDAHDMVADRSQVSHNAATALLAMSSLMRDAAESPHTLTHAV